MDEEEDDEDHCHEEMGGFEEFVVAITRKEKIVSRFWRREAWMLNLPYPGN